MYSAHNNKLWVNEFQKQEGNIAGIAPKRHLSLFFPFILFLIFLLVLFFFPAENTYLIFIALHKHMM